MRKIPPNFSLSIFVFVEHLYRNSIENHLHSECSIACYTIVQYTTLYIWKIFSIFPSPLRVLSDVPDCIIRIPSDNHKIVYLYSDRQCRWERNENRYNFIDESARLIEGDKTFTGTIHNNNYIYIRSCLLERIHTVLDPQSSQLTYYATT